MTNLMYRQTLLRLDIAENLDWLDAKTKDQRVSAVMCKFLRVAAFFKFVMDYHSTVANRLTEKIIAFNLNADGREVEYLLALLKLDPPSAVAHPEFERFCNEMWGDDEEPSYDSKVDLVLAKNQKERVFILQSLPQNYLDLQKATFYDKCSLCKNHGLLSICLLCGESLCSRSCKISNNQDIGNLRLPSRQCGQTLLHLPRWHLRFLRNRKRLYILLFRQTAACFLRCLH